MITAPYIVIGSGLTGATIARVLHDAGERVVVLERRPVVGGNVADAYHPSGIRMNRYGPHYFRTSSARIWTYVCRFGAFYDYRAALMTRVDGRLEQWPIAASCIRRLAGETWTPAFSGTPRNFEQAALALMPRVVYEKFVKEYTEKQWGVPTTTLDADLCGRFDVRVDDDPLLKPHVLYQGIPEDGYSAWLGRMLDGIPVLLNTDFHRVRGALQASKMLIYTGPIDAFFAFDAGRLAYRSQQRTHQYVPEKDAYQPCAQVNVPQHADGPHIRHIEWKHMCEPVHAERIRGTLITTETPYTPCDDDHYEYPFPDAQNRALYQQYRARANEVRDVLICGRLGEYRYYDMDQAIARAMILVERHLN